MAEFRTEYYTPMDRAYHERLAAPAVQSNIEEPILPVNRLGQTVPEHNQIKGTNILQNIQAAIRGGTGSMQIVFMTPVESPMGGRPKAYGEEIRQAIREVALANETMITGMELPTSLTNLSGYDPQRGIVDEEKRIRDLQEVKETIKFAADTARGGSVDIVSFEYDRPLHRANWLMGDASKGIKPDLTAQKAFRQAMTAEEKRSEILFVDKDSGAIARIPIREGIPKFIEKGTWRKKDVATEQPEIFKYKDFEAWAKHERNKKEVSYEEVAVFVKDSFMEEQINFAKGQQGYYAERLRNARAALKEAEEIIAMEHVSEEKKKKARERIEFIEKEIMPSDIAGLEAQKRAEKEHEERQKRLVPMENFVVGKSEESYAEAAIEAMNLQHEHEAKGMPMRELCVGPELGWPNSYGSHPREFVEMILGARKKMERQLIDVQKLSPEQAKEEARAHIKGTFDTSHFGMWLQNFHPEMPWNKRVDKFNEWFNQQINWLAEVNRKEDVIGTIQAVDSAGAGHGHLPPGQGIFPIKKAVETLQAKGGFNGYIVSEGHEEERFGEGRIFLKTWEHFNAPLATGYAAGMPQPRRWGEVAHGYMGRTYSPMFMFGAYAPSNEFRLWSEVPLE